MATNYLPKKFGLKSISLCLLILGAVIILAQWLQLRAKKEINSEVNESQLMIIKEMSANIETLITELQDKMLVWTRIHQLDQMSPTQITHELQDFYELMQKSVSFIGFLNDQGEFEYIYPPISQGKTRGWMEVTKRDCFQNALHQTRNHFRYLPYIGTYYEPVFGKLTVPISIPISFSKPTLSGEEATAQEFPIEENRTKHLFGVLVLFFDQAVIHEICQSHYAHLHDYSSFWLIDEKGIIISHENREWIGRNIFSLYRGETFHDYLPGLDRIVHSKMMKGETGTCLCYDKAEKTYINYTPVRFGERNWSLAISTPEAKMDHWERRVLKTAWQWRLSVISFLLVGLSFFQVVIILIHRKRIDWEKEQKEKFQKAFDGISDLVYMIDINYNLRMANKAFKTLCGKEEQEFEGTKCFHFIQARENPCPDCPIPKTCTTHSTQRLEQIIFQETANLYAYPLIDGEGATTAIVIFARLITREKMLEQKLQHRERLSLLGELSAYLVHEIKNPLVGIGMLSQVVYQSIPKDSPTSDDLERIIRECKRLEQLIDHLGKFSRLEPLTFDREDIHKSLDFSLALLRETLKKNQIHLHTYYQRDLPPIRHDSQKMQQVFLNLLLNAIKAMPQGGELIITTSLHSILRRTEPPSSSSEMACIEIKDSGIGISEEVQEGIFKPFFSAFSKGTGLGLSIVYGIIQQHKGSINLESRAGQGTNFSIYLPLE